MLAGSFMAHFYAWIYLLCALVEQSIQFSLIFLSNRVTNLISTAYPFANGNDLYLVDTISHHTLSSGQVFSFEHLKMPVISDDAHLTFCVCSIFDRCSLFFLWCVLCSIVLHWTLLCWESLDCTAVLPVVRHTLRHGKPHRVAWIVL